ncbi:hypothetical protein BpHYR1_005781 [Brachionus plicatilis]|uniref:RNA-directed DNA polymerase from mobile element jockey-like n=1 Tax=Brachionus plicatilis TaxID=10195 RepID=A0A3M7RH88_BRAPC|nr:hypothetical protein BpHYR1_005781 [Brachionus plicatilis]
MIILTYVLFQKLVWLNSTMSEMTCLMKSKMNKYLVVLEKWLFKWKMKISVEKSCSMIFKNNKESSNVSNKKWDLDLNTLGNLYKSLIGSILDYSFPCLNSLSETNIKRYNTPSNIIHNEAYNKLKLLTVSNRLFELSERYVRAGLSYSVPLTVRLVEEYNIGFESRYIEYSTPLCNCLEKMMSYEETTLLIFSFFSTSKQKKIATKIN